MPVPTLGPSSMPSHRGEDNRDPPTEDDEELEQQQGLFQVPSIQLLGQHMQHVQREQRHLGTHLLWPAGGGGRQWGAASWGETPGPRILLDTAVSLCTSRAEELRWPFLI